MSQPQAANPLGTEKEGKLLLPYGEVTPFEWDGLEQGAVGEFAPDNPVGGEHPG